MKRKNKSDKEDSKKKQFTGVLKYSGLAFQMITIILIVLYGGMKLDEYLENEFPLFTFLGAISGVVLSLYVVLKDLLNKK
ncbi:hypothetical protein GCQ56_16215 [Marinifilum sp. N1E240]|uniref:AtpZ/AtpI family protein n=1 Tax=Marinifilum sp. N1E240 TaxID=2608082 RepID=UPI00128DE35C|nr:AtpZ/AtpI family protein [Marinifilum sp. N1E240]MPQ48550.1 hypothetical protein [Marinifilum sp. N1E240]